MSLGETIAKLRKQHNWSQAELAALVGVHQAHITRMENGRTKPRMKTLDRLAEVFQVSVQELLLSEQKQQPPILGLEDAELATLLGQVAALRPSQREALKTVIRDMLTLTTLEVTLLQRQQAS